MTNFKSYFTLNNIVALIIGIVGLVWLIQGLYRNMKINNINSWPNINATIIGAAIYPTNNKNMAIDPKNIHQLNNSTKYIPKVTYEYQLGNIAYQSNSIIYSGPESFNAADIKALMSNLVPGATIPIYYSPNNFNESYIYNGITNNTPIIIGIILILIAIYLGYYHNFSNKQSYQKNIKNKKTKSMGEINPNFTDMDNPKKTCIVINRS